MDEGDVLTFDLIRNYLIQNDGKVSNTELVKHFKRYLTNPDRERQEAAKLLFRDTINTLATLKQENGVKYVVLRRKHRSTTATCSPHLSSPSRPVQVPYHEPVWPQGRYTSYEVPSPVLETSLNQYSTPPQSGIHPVTRSTFETYPSSEIHSTPTSCSLEDLPQAPPRRRVSSKGKEGLGTRIEEKLRELNKENDTKDVKKGISSCEPVVSPGIVKERKEELNKKASESDIRTKSPLTVSSIGKGNFKLGKDDDDTASVASLSPYRREWTLKAAKGDYNSLARMLKEEPKLANFKDFVSGFTALHWAAKLGNSDIVKLIVGKHGANPNARSHGGYTPLHIAAMFKRMDIMELLNITYGANPSIRDYSGKKAEDYLPKKTPREKTEVTTCPAKTNTIVFRNAELSRTRMGSLNFKVKKTVHAVRGSTRVKSWGSSDQLSEMISSHFVPVAKSYSSKKKKAKQSAEEKKQPTHDSDSDSAYGF